MNYEKLVNDLRLFRESNSTFCTRQLTRFIFKSEYESEFGFNSLSSDSYLHFRL